MFFISLWRRDVYSWKVIKFSSSFSFQKWKIYEDVFLVHFTHDLRHFQRDVFVFSAKVLWIRDGMKKKCYDSSHHRRARAMEIKLDWGLERDKKKLNFRVVKLISWQFSSRILNFMAKVFHLHLNFSDNRKTNKKKFSP